MLYTSRNLSSPAPALARESTGMGPGRKIETQMHLKHFNRP
jgi:hypothetical protein